MNKPNKSRKYLISLSPSEREAIGKKVGVTGKFIYHIGSERRNPSRSIAAKLQMVTRNKVKQSDFDREALAKLSA